jgi:hypothetical protein
MAPMRCPACNTTIREERAAFCPRCGRALGAPEGQTTLQTPGGNASADGATTEISGKDTLEPAPEGRGSAVEPRRARLSDLAVSVRRSAASAGWTETATIALFGFLMAMALGSVLVLGAKLQYPSVGAAAGVFSGFEVIVMAGLAVLGAPIAIGNLSLSAVPLGALAIVGWAIVWATRKRTQEAGQGDVRSAVVAGAKIAVPLGAMCFLAALLFRIGEEPSPISVNPVAALFVGAMWGGVSGALGGYLAAVDVRKRATEIVGRIAGRSRVVAEGAVSGALMLTITFVLGAIFTLLWVVVILARGPDGFGWGEALASLIYMVSFGPNMVVSVIAVSLGAPVEVGAQVTVGGNVVGPLRDVSLFSGDLSWVSFGLILVPLVACFAGGYSARLTTKIPKQGAGILGIAVLTFSSVLAALAMLADARLGAGLVRSRGFALIAPNAALVFLTALAWAAVVGYVGWWYAESHFPSRNSGAIDGFPAPENEPSGVGTSR